MLKLFRNRTPYIKQTYKEIEEASKLVGITPKQGEMLVNNYFRSLKLFMDDDRVPKIIVPILGIFRPTLGRIRRTLQASYRSLKKESIPRRIHEYRVRKLMVIRRRLLQEKSKIVTRPYWSNIPFNYAEELYKDDLKYVKDFYYGEEKNVFRESVGKKPYTYKSIKVKLE